MHFFDRMARLYGLLFALFLLSGCAPAEHLLITVSVDGLTPDVQALAVDVSLDARVVLPPFQVTNNLARFAVRLPNQEDQRGSVQIRVAALATDQCKVSTGTTSVVTSGAAVAFDAPVTLQPVDAMGRRKCPVNIEVIGSGTVTASDGMTQQQCTDRCQLDYLQGSTIGLSAVSMPKSYASLWGTDCGGPLSVPCNLVMQQPRTVQASFVDSTCSPDGWCFQNPLPQGNSLRGARAVDAMRTVVYGDHGTLLLCGNGAPTCRALRSGTTAALTDAWSADADHVYLVGESGTILRCSANTGTCSTLAAGLVSRKFAAVWGSDADHIFAVADIGVIVRCIAESCQQLTTNTNSSFTSVQGIDAENVFAVGQTGTILRCGSSSTACSALTSGTTSYLQAAWAQDRNNIYAVGSTGSIVRCAVGSTSCTVLTPNPSTSFTSVWGSDANNVLLTGMNGTLYRCSAGSTTCPLIATPTTGGLNQIWGRSNGKIYLVGSAQGALFRCALDGTGCQPLPAGTSQFLSAVGGPDGQNIYAVGTGGILLRCSDTSASCQTLSPGPPERFNATYALDPDHVYAVGDAGVVYRCSASLNRCTRFRSNSAQNLNDVFAVDLQNIYAVGGGGTILRCDDTTEVCTVFPIQGSSALTGVWAADPGFIVAAGLNGQLRKCSNNGLCTNLCGVLPTTSDFRSVVGLSSTSVWAVGSNNTPVTQWNGSGCSGIFNKTASATLTLNHTGVLNSSAIFAVGSTLDSGPPSALHPTVLRCTTTGCAEFDTLQSPAQELARGWAGNQSTIWGVGANGTVLRCSTTTTPYKCITAPAITGSNLRAVFGLPTAANFFAAGTQGALLNCSTGSATCQLQDSGTNLDLQAGVIVNDTAAYLLGNNSAILRYVP